MPVITRCIVEIYALEQFDGRLIIRVLGYEFSVNGKVKNFALGLLDCGLQVSFTLFYLVNQRKPSFYF